MKPATESGIRLLGFLLFYIVWIEYGWRTLAVLVGVWYGSEAIGIIITKIGRSMGR